MTTPLIEARSVRVTYRRGRTRTTAVHGVDLVVRPGRTVGVVGESGSGKSSVGNAVLGLVPVESGTVRFRGEDVTAASARRRRELSRRMQVVFQDPYGSLNPARSVGDTLAEGLRFGQGVRAAEAAARVEQVLAEVGLDPSAARRFPGAFSGGQRQRIAIARAVVGDPEFVVCDEPVSALDLSVQAQVLNLLARLQAERGLGYLFISHDLGVVRYLSDDVVVMHAGRVVESGPAAQVGHAPVHPYTRALVAAAPVPDPDEQRRHRAARLALQRTTATALPTGGCSFAARCAFATDVCRTTVPPPVVVGPDHVVACHHAADLPALVAAPATAPAPTRDTVGTTTSHPEALRTDA
ncbi:ATP-binding cassette domain-containing protein [Angustibacter speluncae]